MGIKLNTSDLFGMAHIDSIIREELGHVVKLVGHLGQT